MEVHYCRNGYIVVLVRRRARYRRSPGYACNVLAFCEAYATGKFKRKTVEQKRA